MSQELIKKIVWQSANGDPSWNFALCPNLAVNMVSFQVQGGYFVSSDAAGTGRATTKTECAEVSRRLLACWKFCDGIKIERLEGNPSLKELVKLYYDALPERDSAREELKALREVISANPEESTLDEVRRVINQRDRLLTVLQAAIDCGMVPQSSAAEGGASKYSVQVRVADDIRAIVSTCMTAPSVKAESVSP